MSTVPVCQAIRHVPVLLGGSGRVRPLASRHPSVPFLCRALPGVAPTSPFAQAYGLRLALRCDAPETRLIPGEPR